MIVTEEEAKTPAPSQLTTCNAPVPHNCIASACMAWRWRDLDTVTRGQAYAAGEDVKGYCGKAGTP